MAQQADKYQDIRDAVRALCATYPDEYFRRVDMAREYPAEFVDALTKAGWLAALIPQEYGGSGLGLAEASVIMEEINRSGGNSGACHGQMYNMGTLLRHGSAAAEGALPAEDRQRRAAPAEHGRDRAHHRHRHHEDQDQRGEEGRPLRGQRPEGVDLAHPAQRPDDPAGAHHAAGRRGEEERRHVDLHRRPAPGHRPRPDGAADRQHGQPRDQRAVLREPGDPGREPDRPGRAGLQVHPRRAECRAHADRRRMHRRRLLVHRPGDEVRQGARGLRPADRQEPGRAVPDRREPTSRSRPPT